MLQLPCFLSYLLVYTCVYFWLLCPFYGSSAYCVHLTFYPTCPGPFGLSISKHTSYFKNNFLSQNFYGHFHLGLLHISLFIGNELVREKNDRMHAFISAAYQNRSTFILFPTAVISLSVLGNKHKLQFFQISHCCNYFLQEFCNHFIGKNYNLNDFDFTIPLIMLSNCFSWVRIVWVRISVILSQKRDLTNYVRYHHNLQ